MPRCGLSFKSSRKFQFDPRPACLFVAVFLLCFAHSCLGEGRNSTATIPALLNLSQIRSDGSLPVCSVPNREQALHVAPETCDLDDWPPGRFGWEIGDEILLVRHVAEVSESTLTLVLEAVQGGSNQVSRHVAVLYYASWCPFSQQLRPVFEILAALNPATIHVAIEEGRMRRSLLTQVGVVSFPALYFHNRTSRSKFRGPRTDASLQDFECNFTGVRDTISQNEGELSLPTAFGDVGSEKLPLEPCPYAWVKHPEQLLHEHVWLLLAVLFLSLRILCWGLPLISKRVTARIRTPVT